MNFESRVPKEFVKDVVSGVPNTHVEGIVGMGTDYTHRFSFSTESKWKHGGLYVQLNDIHSVGYKYHSGNQSRSGFVTGSLDTKKNHFKIVTFVGEQKNELSWLGVPMDSIVKDRKYNSNTTRENDHFLQFHSQFLHSYDINNHSRLNYTVYYNYIKGNYYFDGVHIGEPDSLFGYNLLSNFVGVYFNYSFNYKNFGLYTGFNEDLYEREHLGTTNEIKIYTNKGRKGETSVYVKGTYRFYNFNIYGDLQYRHSYFSYKGEVEMIPFVWNFFNYSFGINLKFDNDLLYYTIGKSNREPSRNDIFGGYDNLWSSVGYYNLKPEEVLDQEIGYKYFDKRTNLNINLFYMNFRNELILTGEMGPTGLPLHTNVDKSKRYGVEFDFSYKWDIGIQLSQNTSYNYSQIAWSGKETIPVLTPIWILNQEISYTNRWFNFGINCRYQDYSYIDNNNQHSIPGYYTLNTFVGGILKFIELDLYFNNITNEKYFSSGMMSGNIPLYFVSQPFNFFVQIKIHI
jgi:iron complex outermembrane recepter protein